MQHVESKYFIVGDIGGTSFKAKVDSPRFMRQYGRIYTSRHPKLNDKAYVEDSWETQGRLRGVMDEARSSLRHHGQKFVAVGVSMPDPADYERGISLVDHKKGILPLKDVRLRDVLLDPTSTADAEIPIYYMNDGNAGAKGVVHTYGKNERILVVTFGNGLGGGFINHGELATTTDGAPVGGEIWNLDIYRDPRGEYIHTEDPERRLETRVSRGAIIDGYGAPELDVVDIAAFARGGDTAAVEIFNKFGSAFGDGLVYLAERFEPNRLIVTGGPSGAHDLFMPTAWEVFEHGYLNPTKRQVNLSIEPETNFNLIGAALNAREQLARAS